MPGAPVTRDIAIELEFTAIGLELRAECTDVALRAGLSRLAGEGWQCKCIAGGNGCGEANKSRKKDSEGED